MDNKTITQSFNAVFCTHLEYEISKAFQNSGDPILRWVGCDGISPLPRMDRELGLNYILQFRKLTTIAWMLGDVKYPRFDATIKFWEEINCSDL